MSSRAITWALEGSKARQTDLLVLIAIADCANEDNEANVSVRRIAKVARVSPSTVHRHLRHLTVIGELAIDHQRDGQGHQSKSTYRLPKVPESQHDTLEPVPDSQSARRSEQGKRAQTRKLRHSNTTTNDGERPNGLSRAEPRNELFDALATAGRQVDLVHLPASMAKTVGVKLAELRKAQPDVTPDMIHERASLYRTLHPDWALTPAALVKHWAELVPGADNGNRPKSPSMRAIEASRRPMQI